MQGNAEMINKWAVANLMLNKARELYNKPQISPSNNPYGNPSRSTYAREMITKAGYKYGV